MAELSISYSHQDELLAARVRKLLNARGRSVWIDESGDYSATGEGVNLPWGQAHWEVITREFAAAQTVVVLDTPNWRQSPYCADEYRFLQEWGKRVEFINLTTQPVTDEYLSAQVDAILAGLNENRELTAAHTRIVEAARLGGTRSGSLFDRLLNRGEARDAHVLLDADLADSGLTVTPPVEVHARNAISTAERTRRRLRRLGITTVATLAILAVVGVAAMFFARAGNRSAAVSAAHSESLDLSVRATTEPDTLIAKSYAAQAITLDPTSEAKSAVNIAQARDERTRVVTMDDLDYFAAAWSGDGNVVAGASRSKLQTVEVHSGARGPVIDLADPLQLNTLVISASGDRAAYRGAKTGSLHLVDLRGGQSVWTSIQTDVVSVTSDGNDIWFGTGDHGLWSMPFEPGAAPVKRADLGSTALALAVSERAAGMDLVDDRGNLRSITLNSTGLQQLSSQSIAPAESLAPASRGGVAVVRRCGANVFGAIEGRFAIHGVEFSAVDGQLATKRHFGNAFPMECSPSKTGVWSGSLGTPPTGEGAPLLPAGALRYVVANSPVGDRSAVLTNTGLLYLPNSTITRETNPNFSAAFAVGGANYVVHPNGDITKPGDVEPLSNIGPKFGRRIAGPVRDQAAFLLPDGVIAVDSGGRKNRLADGHFDAVRESSDGRNFILTSAGNVVVLLDAVTGGGREVKVNGMSPDTSIRDADVSPDGKHMVVVTSDGRLGNVEVATGQARRVGIELGASSRNSVCFVSPDEYVVTSGDGAVRLMDTSDNPVITVGFGGAVDNLTHVGQYLVASSADVGSKILDARTLVTKDLIPAEMAPLNPRTVRVNMKTKRLEGTALEHDVKYPEPDFISVPLPTI